MKSSLTPRLLIIGALTVTSVLYALPWSHIGINLPFLSQNYKLGLDLNGGVELDYSVDLSKATLSGSTSKSDDQIIEGLKSIIEKRVNSLGTAEPTIISQSYGGEPHIVVQIPTLNFGGEQLTDAQKAERNSEFIKQAKEIIGNVVQLEFKEQKTEITEEDKKERKTLAEKILVDITKKEFSFDTLAKKYKSSYENISYFSGTGTESEIPTELKSEKFKQAQGPITDISIEETTAGMTMSFDADGKSQIIEGQKGYLILSIPSIQTRESEKTTGTGVDTKVEKVQEKVYAYQGLWVSQKPSEWKVAKTEDGKILNEQFLFNANVSLNQVMQPQVELNFNAEGAKIFASLTQRLVGKQIAIFVGGELLTAPVVNAVIPDGKAVITGNYSSEEARKLANNINTGIVPAPIYLTSERTIDAKIGSDSLTVIIQAGIIGLFAVLIFMVAIYRVCGLLAGFALVLYSFMIFSIFKFFGVVLTLAGIAGVILSIGLAIDANVLIFERMKEALREKQSLARATLIGFEKSWSAIWDSHLTSITSALVLFIFGVSLIKGFGLALLIGIVLSLFTAMWVSRVLVLWISQKMDGKEEMFIGLKK